MSLWVDKYRPTTFSKLDYHKEQAEYLKNMVIIKKLKYTGKENKVGLRC